jgi:DNA-binding transcriptional regulator LsrR (DeoR family)
MPRKAEDDPATELRNLFKKLLALQLFQLGVPQGEIAKRLKVNKQFVNDFLKGIRKPNGKE